MLKAGGMQAYLQVSSLQPSQHIQMTPFKMMRRFPGATPSRATKIQSGKLETRRLSTIKTGFKTARSCY